MGRLPTDVHITRVISYLRRSREDLERERRTGEDTISLQKELMTRLLVDYALPYDQVAEIGSGDKIASRPVFQQVLADLQTNKYNCIAVKDISRLTRGDFSDYGLVYELIVQKRIYILTPYRLYDPKNRNDLRQMRFELFLSREEFETIRERMQGAKYSYALAGKFMGSTPAFGYRCNAATQRLEIDEQAAETVRLIFSLYVNGLPGKSMGFRAIASYLTRIGIASPTGLSTWNPQTVKKILQNPVYTGEIHYSTSTELERKRVKKPREEWIVVPSAHPPLIPDSLFALSKEKAQRKQQPATRLDFATSELSGLVRCKACQRKMIRQVSRQRYRKKDGELSIAEKETLWCTTPGCTYVKYRAVEEMLLQFLAGIEPPARPVRDVYIKRYLHAEESGHAAYTDQPRARLQTQKAALEARLALIFRSFENGIYSEQDFLQRKTAVQAELEHVENSLAACAPPPPLEETRTRFDPDALTHTLSSFAAIYLALPTAKAKNQLLHALIETVQLERIHKGTRRSPATFHLEIRFAWHHLLSFTC